MNNDSPRLGSFAAILQIVPVSQGVWPNAFAQAGGAEGRQAGLEPGGGGTLEV